LKSRATINSKCVF